ncbi:MAG: hypothetical protein Q8880_00715 [Bacteroidota bacterium]|nr:hypothetical protein [Bacteroidota bacterium]
MKRIIFISIYIITFLLVNKSSSLFAQTFGGNSGDIWKQDVSNVACTEPNIAVGGDQNITTASTLFLVGCITPNLSLGGNNSGFKASTLFQTSCVFPNISYGGNEDGNAQRILNLITCPGIPNIALGGITSLTIENNVYLKICPTASDWAALAYGGDNDGHGKSRKINVTCPVPPNIAMGGTEDNCSPESNVALKVCPYFDWSYNAMGGNNDGHSISTLVLFGCSIPNLAYGGAEDSTKSESILSLKSCNEPNIAISGDNGDGISESDISLLTCTVENIASGGYNSGNSKGKTYLNPCTPVVTPPQGGMANGGNDDGLSISTLVMVACTTVNLASGGNKGGFINSILNLFNCSQPPNLALGGNSDGYICKIEEELICPAFDSTAVSSGGDEDGYSKARISNLTCVLPYNVTSGGYQDGTSTNIINQITCTWPNIAYGGDGYITTTSNVQYLNCPGYYDISY